MAKESDDERLIVGRKPAERRNLKGAVKGKLAGGANHAGDGEGCIAIGATGF